MDGPEDNVHGGPPSKLRRSRLLAPRTRNRNQAPIAAFSNPPSTASDIQTTQTTSTSDTATLKAESTRPAAGPPLSTTASNSPPECNNNNINVKPGDNIKLLPPTSTVQQQQQRHQQPGDSDCERRQDGLAGEPAQCSSPGGQVKQQPQQSSATPRQAARPEPTRATISAPTTTPTPTLNAPAPTPTPAARQSPQPCRPICGPLLEQSSRAGRGLPSPVDVEASLRAARALFTREHQWPARQLQPARELARARAGPQDDAVASQNAARHQPASGHSQQVMQASRLLIERQIQAIQAADSRRWNFDFQNCRPLGQAGHRYVSYTSVDTSAPRNLRPLNDNNRGQPAGPTRTGAGGGGGATVDTAPQQWPHGPHTNRADHCSGRDNERDEKKDV